MEAAFLNNPTKHKRRKMHIFITGGTGLFGSACVRHLISQGHTITALARSATSAKILFEMGATPVLGSTSDHSILADQAEKADSTVYCAYDHQSPEIFGAEATVEREAITAICRTMEGSGNMLFYCSGLAWFPSSPIADETTPLDWFRSGTDSVVDSYASNGVRPVRIRLAMAVHSPFRIHPFVKALYREDHISYYKDGSNLWNAVDPDDAAALVGLVLAQETKVPPGRTTTLHAFAEKISTLEIAKVLGEVTGLPLRRFTDAEIEGTPGFVKMVLTESPGVINDWTRKTFGWEPKGRSLVDDMRKGRWFVKEGRV